MQIWWFLFFFFFLHMQRRCVSDGRREGRRQKNREMRILFLSRNKREKWHISGFHDFEMKAFTRTKPWQTDTERGHGSEVGLYDGYWLLLVNGSRCRCFPRAKRIKVSIINQWMPCEGSSNAITADNVIILPRLPYPRTLPPAFFSWIPRCSRASSETYSFQRVPGLPRGLFPVGCARSHL